MSRVYPFHCGTQSLDWMISNCEADCGKYNEKAPHKHCEILAALDEAYWSDGSVSEEMGRRMGIIKGESRLVWPCPEHDPPWRIE